MIKEIPGHFQHRNVRDSHRIIPVPLPVTEQKDFPEYISRLHQIQHIPLSGCKVLADLNLPGEKKKQPCGKTALLENIGPRRIFLHTRSGAFENPLCLLVRNGMEQFCHFQIFQTNQLPFSAFSSFCLTTRKIILLYAL